MKKRKMLKLWKRFSYLMGQDQLEPTIEEEDEIIRIIDENLPFKDAQEHDHWLDVLMGFKFWEDFEELTLEIINRMED